MALVAQWIARKTSNLEVAGSSPVESVYGYFFFQILLTFFSIPNFTVVHFILFCFVCV